MKNKDALLKEVIMNWKPDKNSKTPVYLQIVKYMCSRVSKGDWPPGSRLPSQRCLAELFEVNRSTIVTAMDELSSLGIIQCGFGGGTKISKDVWSLLAAQVPDWNKYVKSGFFKENIPQVQIINKLEFKDYVRLGTGEPSPELFPHSMMEKVLIELSKKIHSMNYLEPLGLKELRQALSERLLKSGISVSPDCILITSGSLQALQLISACMLKPASTVFIEAPSYLKSLQVFQSAGMSLSGVPMDSSGIKYWTMENDLISADKQGLNKLLYTIPSYQNPTGILMSHERRDDLLKFCQRHSLPVIEDSAYSELWLDQEPPASLKSRDKNGLVLYIGTVSKTLAPGLRIGWIAGPEPVIQRMGDVKMQMDYGASSISQWVLTEFLQRGLYDKYLDELRKELILRRNNAAAALSEFFSGLADWNMPSGGFYIWLKFREDISINRLFKEAVKRRILLNPGDIYDFSSNRALRISYSYEDCDTFRKAAGKLSEIARGIIK